MKALLITTFAVLTCASAYAVGPGYYPHPYYPHHEVVVEGDGGGVFISSSILATTALFESVLSTAVDPAYPKEVLLRNAASDAAAYLANGEMTGLFPQVLADARPKYIAFFKLDPATMTDADQLQLNQAIASDVMDAAESLLENQ